MFFNFLQAYARLAIKLYCKKIIINKPEWLQASGPLLIAANHPNSFLDGIILATLFKKPIYSLARGDAFKNEKHNKILRSLQLLPVYRTSEGIENLEHNYTTFEACQQVFAQNGIVMIFSEGRCINEWHLRPLKKGTARLAISSWLKDLDVTVVPLGFNYSPFRQWGKTVHLNFGTPLNKTDVLQHASDGKKMLAFNNQLQHSLHQLVYEINKGDKQKIRSVFFYPSSFVKLFILAIPALVGFVLHAPLYVTAKALTKKYFDNDHFDSVVVSMLVLAYPLYLFLLVMAAGFVFGWMALLLLLLIPFTAWAVLQWKHQLDYQTF